MSGGKWTRDGDRAAWYAWGRLDSGHPPVVLENGEPSTVLTVFTFAELYGAAHMSLDAGERVSAPSMMGAWDAFVASAGTTVDRPAQVAA